MNFQHGDLVRLTETALNHTLSKVPNSPLKGNTGTVILVTPNLVHVVWDKAVKSNSRRSTKLIPSVLEKI